MGLFHAGTILNIVLARFMIKKVYVQLKDVVIQETISKICYGLDLACLEVLFWNNNK